MSNYTIIHHNDLDGIGAAAIVYNYVTTHVAGTHNFNFVPYKYDDVSAKAVNDALLVAAQEGHYVFVVDIAISETNIHAIDNIYKIAKDNLVWCDHHASSVLWIKSTIGTNEELHYNGIVNPRRCGACQVYQYLYNCTFRKVPKFVRLIDDYDRWILSTPESRYFNTVFYADNELKKDPTSSVWKAICSPGCGFEEICYPDHVFNELLTKGKNLCDYHESENQTARDTKMYNAKISLAYTEPGEKSEYVEYSALAMNHSGNPDVFGEERNRNDIDVCFTYYVTRNGGVKYSFRSSHGWVRCDIIAKYLGGGGHQLAAGAYECNRVRLSNENIVLYISKEDMKIVKNALKKRPSIT